MTRTLLLAALPLFAALLASCNKQPEQQAGPAPSTLEYKTPVEAVIDNSENLGRATRLDAKANADATPEQLAAVRAALITVAPQSAFVYMEADEQFMSQTDKTTVIAVDQAVQVVVGRALSEKAEFEQPVLERYASAYFSDSTALIVAQQQQHERAERTDPSGRIYERAEQQGLPKLDPAVEIVGKWMSLRELGVASGANIIHDANYHQLFDVRPDHTLHWVYYSRGAEFSNDTYKWEYKKASGELVLSHMNGTPYQTLKAFTTQQDPGTLYIETPGLDQIKVFGPAQEAVPLATPRQPR